MDVTFWELSFYGKMIISICLKPELAFQMNWLIGLIQSSYGFGQILLIQSSFICSLTVHVFDLQFAWTEKNSSTEILTCFDVCFGLRCCWKYVIIHLKPFTIQDWVHYYFFPACWMYARLHSSKLVFICPHICTINLYVQSPIWGCEIFL